MLLKLKYSEIHMLTYVFVMCLPISKIQQTDMLKLPES